MHYYDMSAGHTSVHNECYMTLIISHTRALKHFLPRGHLLPNITFLIFYSPQGVPSMRRRREVWYTADSCSPFVQPDRQELRMGLQQSPGLHGAAL